MKFQNCILINFVMDAWTSQKKFMPLQLFQSWGHNKKRQKMQSHPTLKDLNLQLELSHDIQPITNLLYNGPFSVIFSGLKEILISRIIQASLCKIQGLFKDFPTVLKVCKL